jgi:hypothetical protein
MDSSGDTNRVDNARLTLVAIAACVTYVLLLAWIPAFTAGSPVLCLTRRFLGLNCPSCGLTRAMACLARLDPASAVRFHPLVILVAPLVAVVAIDAFLAAIGRRGLVGAIPRPLVRGFWVALLAGFWVVFLVRTASWFAPEWNPTDWMIPPAAFPP